MPKAVLFDLFGTLVDNFTQTAAREMRHELARALGVGADAMDRAWKETFDARMSGKLGPLPNIMRALALECGGKPSEQQIETAVAARIRFSEEHLKPRPHAIECLKEIRSMGIATGLLSNCTGEIPDLWQKSPFADLVDHTFFSCEQGMRKPDSRFFQSALSALKVEPQHCLYVADGDNGELAAATTLGMPALMIRSGEDEFRADEETWAGPSISSLDRVLDYVG